jgi:hypothetical protein
LKDKATGAKVCTCFPGDEVGPEGRCEEAKDLGILDLTKLFRKPSWSELNPGRRKFESVKDQVTGLF